MATLFVFIPRVSALRDIFCFPVFFLPLYQLYGVGSAAG